jgi:hypothetical protein
MAAQITHPTLSRSIGALLLTALSATALAGLAGPPSASAFEAKGRVRYAYRSCATAGDSKFTGLGAAMIVLRDPQTADLVAVTQTDPAGHFSVEVGSRAVTARVILDSPEEFTVTRKAAHPYSYPLGEFTRKEPSRSSAFTSEDASGAMNIFNALAVGAGVAGDLAFQAGPVTAVFDPDRDLKPNNDLPGVGSWYSVAQNRLFIDANGRRNGDEWEPWVALHEYGHHILNSLHAVGGKTTTSGSHHGDIAYPDAPGLAWSEGFADAFGTLAQDSSPLYGAASGVAMRGCHVNDDLGATPPVPTPPPNNPQYNETAAASVIWGLSSYLGGGEDIDSRAAGIRSLVRVARGFYRPPEDMYDVRAALTSAPEAEASPVDHERIDKIFGARGHMAWGKGLAIASTANSDGISQLHLRLEGPGYQGCAVSDRTSTFTPQGTTDPYPGVMVPGALDYTWQDDCLIWSADAESGDPDDEPGAPTEEGADSGELLFAFPLRPNGGQRTGSYKLYATWLCQDIPPAGDHPGSFCDSGLQHAATVCTPVNSNFFDPCSGNPVGSSLATITLARNQPDRLLLEFTADGRYCKLFGDGGAVDCATGTAWR